MEPMLPVAKIGVGIGLVLLGVVLVSVPAVGLFLLIAGLILVAVGLVQRREPIWRIRSLIHQAKHHPETAENALQQALAIDPENPEALAASAQHAFEQQDWQQAAMQYETYLGKAPSDWRAEAHLAASYLNVDDPDRAIPHFQNVRAVPDLTEESRLTLTNGLAAAFLRKADGGQALEILKTLPLQRHSLDQPLEQSLFLRAVSHYQLHQTSEAMRDLDRLYALDPNYPNLQQVKDQVQAGTYSIDAIHVSTEGV